MNDKTANFCRLDYFITSVEVKEGKKGSWAKVKGYYEATGRDGDLLNVEVRCTAFGVVADRLATLKPGEMVRAEFDLGGWKNDKGYINPDYLCVSVSRPWPKVPERGTVDSGGMNRGRPAPQEQGVAPDVDDDQLPF